jgi:hypothetical protein
LWLDEAVTANIALSPVTSYIHFAKGDLHPPLYYLLLHFWSFFGRDESTLRLFSVLTNVLAGFVLFVLVRRMFNSRIAVLTLLLFTISPFQIRYSQEVRMYSLLGLWIALVLFFVWRFLTSKRWPFLLGYVLSSALGLYTHYQAGVFLIILNGIVVFRLYQAERTLLLRWFLAQCMVFTLFAPWLPNFINQVKGRHHMVSLSPSFPLLVSPLFSFLWETRFCQHYQAPKANLPQVSEIGSVIMDRQTGHGDRPHLIVLIIWKKSELTRLSWPIHFYRISSCQRSIIFCLVLHVEYLRSSQIPVWSLVSFYIVVAHPSAGLSRFNRKMGIGMTFLVVLIQVFMLIAYYQPRNYREDWRGAVAYIAKHSRPDEVVGFHFDQPMGPYLYYSDGSIPAFGFLTNGEVAPALATINKNKCEGIWLFDYLAELYDPRGLVRQQIVGDGYVQAWHHEFNGVPLTLWRRNLRLQ